MSSKRALFLWLAVLGVSAALVQAQPPGRGHKKDKSKAGETTQAYVPPADASQYVGSDTCKTCHEDMPTKGFYKTFEDSPHFVTTLDTKGGPGMHGCEACHGPGKAHVDGGGDKTKIFTFKDVSAQEISARCLSCHQYDDEHSNFLRSGHLQAGVSCIDCHDPHHPKESQYLMKEKQPQLCYGCHVAEKQQFGLPFHHRVNEGYVSCNDCHNPHGSFLNVQLRASATEDIVCFKCHSEKAGPFVYEHEAVKIEGCTACHTPHGSSNARLLKVNQVNILCLQCHAFAAGMGAPATPSGPAHNQAQKYQACTMCHTAIHGSNSSSVFFTP
ncbi:MAG TPA: DmsE family decaheme c-type cytochrome [Candidatus Acidoferrum sp.]|nr:DmsE family decaheme c-type cytochrome [Candidatus Acidoferrum sp.]